MNVCKSSWEVFPHSRCIHVPYSLVPRPLPRFQCWGRGYVSYVHTHTHIHCTHTHTHTHTHAHTHTHTHFSHAHWLQTEPAYRGQGLGLEASKLMMGYGMHYTHTHSQWMNLWDTPACCGSKEEHLYIVILFGDFTMGRFSLILPTNKLFYPIHYNIVEDMHGDLYHNAWWKFIPTNKPCI